MTAGAPGGCGCGGSCSGGPAPDTGCGCGGTCGGGASSTGCGGGTRPGWSSPIQAPAGMGYLLRNAIATPQQRTSDHAERHYKKACRDATGATVPCEDDESNSSSSSTSNGSSTGKPDTGSYGAKACLDPVTGAPEPCWESPYYSGHSSATTTSESCSYDIQTLVDLENDLGATITDGSGINRVADCTRLGLPSNADDQTCFGSLGSLWNHRSESECLPPLLNRTTSTQACNHSSEEMDFITRWTVFGGCHDTMERLLRKAWCLLLENLDIADWVLCMVYGPNAGSCLQDIIGGARDVGLECATNISPAAQAFWGTGTVTFNPQHEDLLGMKAMFESGDDEDRLCAVIRASALLFHELQHVCLLGGFYNSDWQGSIFEERCEPTWLTYSTYTYAMYLRYPQARRSRCCVENLTALAWSSVPGDFIWQGGCEK